MEIVRFKAETHTSWFTDGPESIIMPIADIQFGAKGCDVDRLQRHLDWGMRKGAYFVGVGDYQDVMSPSNRRLWLKFAADAYDSPLEAFDEKMEDTLEQVKRLLEPTRGRWLGLIKGHHFHVFGQGDTTVSRLAKYLKCPDLGDCASVTIEQKDANGKICRTIMWLHHGNGSGVLSGSALNWLEVKARGFFAHMYLAGHRHTKPVVPIPFITAHWRNGPKFDSINRYLVACGGWLKGYEMNTKDPMGNPTGSYVEKAGMSPITLGGPVIFLRPRFRNGVAAPDINVSV